MDGAYLYILRCADGSYYVGTTISGLDGGSLSIKPGRLAAIRPRDDR